MFLNGKLIGLIDSYVSTLKQQPLELHISLFNNMPYYVKKKRSTIPLNLWGLVGTGFSEETLQELASCLLKGRSGLNKPFLSNDKIAANSAKINYLTSL